MNLSGLYNFQSTIVTICCSQLSCYVSTGEGRGLPVARAQGPDWHRPVVELLTGTSPALTFFRHRSLMHISLEYGFTKESYYR